MINIFFEDIDKTNEHIVRNIKLRPEQEKFIETVDECLKEADTYNEWCPVAIYNDEEIIGFEYINEKDVNGELIFKYTI